MLKDLLGSRIRVGLASIEMRELPDFDGEISPRFQDTIEGKAVNDCLRVEFKRRVWFEPESTFEIAVTYFVEHELKEAGSLSALSQEEIDAEIKKEPRFYIQERQGFVARITLLISQITASFGGSPLISPPNYHPEIST